MIKITLPDGSIREYEGVVVTGTQIAESIGAGLAKAALAVTVDGVQRDLSDPIKADAKVSIITVDSPEGLEIMRHTVAAQVLARAVKNLYPSAKLAIGPTIEDGFYYDVAFQEPISSDDLEKIEKEMRKIIETHASISKSINSKADTIAAFKERGEDYKVKIVEESEQKDGFQLYAQGDTGFVDLCRGPHVPTLKHIGAFKLTKLAGAYWRGDSNNEMLTRIYGTAWKNDKDLKEYLHRMEEAEKRDHRKIGKEMDLFHMQGEAPGQVFWHDGGWTIFKELEGYIRGKLRRHNYQEVNTPRLINKDLYIKSGHWGKFGENGIFTSNAYEHEHALKPMNCPCHVEIFKNDGKSYRDLPIRMSEFGNCFRQEARGALHGLMRVTSMTQDDAHIFCTVEQIEQEVILLNDLIAEIYAELGFESYFVRFSDRPDARVGSDEIWDAAENGLKKACEAAGVDVVMNPGEGAFYGPKLEYVLKDCIGREWQCGTIQLDFNQPNRLGAFYVDVDGEKKHPVMIHRALLGSLERFIGILIEHYAGHLPLWLAPTQIVVSGIVEDHNPHVEKAYKRLKDAGFRVKADLRNEKINYKIREHMHAKVAMVGVIGEKEAAEDTITIRRLGAEGQKTYKMDEFIAMCHEEVKTKALPLSHQKDKQAA
mgnify:CR=1 FL=1|tara:strand:- start:2689 stop:4647 length:1959 start_codon:yes stop_codon:yes gene_type:complete